MTLEGLPSPLVPASPHAQPFCHSLPPPCSANVLVHDPMRLRALLLRLAQSGTAVLPMGALRLLAAYARSAPGLVGFLGSWPRAGQGWKALHIMMASLPRCLLLAACSSPPAPRCTSHWPPRAQHASHALARTQACGTPLALLHTSLPPAPLPPLRFPAGARACRLLHKLGACLFASLYCPCPSLHTAANHARTCPVCPLLPQPVPGGAGRPRAGRQGSRQQRACHLPGSRNDAPPDRAARHRRRRRRAGPRRRMRGSQGRQRAQRGLSCLLLWRGRQLVRRRRLSAVDVAAGGDRGCHAGGTLGAHFPLSGRQRECLPALPCPASPPQLRSLLLRCTCVGLCILLNTGQHSSAQPAQHRPTQTQGSLLPASVLQGHFHPAQPVLWPVAGPAPRPELPGPAFKPRGVGPARAHGHHGEAGGESRGAACRGARTCRDSSVTPAATVPPASPLQAKMLGGYFSDAISAVPF